MSKILLVDDDKILVEMYKLKLEHAGFDVETAADGQDGLNKIRNLQPDLILLDLLLPKISGKELLDKIRFDDEVKKIPVAILSNLDNPNIKSDLLRKGVVGYFVKSELLPDQVVERVKEILDNRG